MAILGVESAIFGVDDLEVCTRFWNDFGLVPVARTKDESVFEVPSGSRVVVMRSNDPRLPPTAANWSDGLGIRETIFGVDTPQALEALAEGLSRDREVRRDPDGTVHFRADDGMPVGLRVWKKKHNCLRSIAMLRSTISSSRETT